MFLFLIKKTVFNFWDNLGAILLINLGYFVILACTVYLSSPFPPFHIISLLIYFTKFALFFIYTGAINRIIRHFADSSSVSFSDFIPYVKASWKSSLLFSVFVLCIFLNMMAGITYFTRVTGFISTIGLATLFWIMIIFCMSLPYFFPFEAISKEGAVICLKKTILMFMDNIYFSLALLMGVLIISVISIIFAFLIPGIGVLLLWYNVAVKLRMAKYDYLKQYPDVNRREIPWREVLKDDIGQLSSRTLKSIIFPWKE